jgi:hypothetical protein
MFCIFDGLIGDVDAEVLVDRAAQFFSNALLCFAQQTHWCTCYTTPANNLEHGVAVPFKPRILVGDMLKTGCRVEKKNALEFSECVQVNFRKAYAILGFSVDPRSKYSPDWYRKAKNRIAGNSKILAKNPIITSKKPVKSKKNKKK